MNKGYIRINDNAIISDNNGNFTVTKYHPQLDEVLAQENLIEVIENNIKELKEESKKYSKKFIPKNLIIIVIALFIMLMIMSNFFKMLLAIVPNNIIGSIIGIYVGTIGLTEYYFFRKGLKKSRIINAELYYLEKKLEVEKEKLKELNQGKTENKCVEHNTFKVDDEKLLEPLNTSLDLFRKVGSNPEKYYRYLDQDPLKLDKELRSYGPTRTRLVRNYLEEKRATSEKPKKLTRTRKRKDSNF